MILTAEADVSRAYRALLNLKHGDKKLVKFQSEGETGYLSIFAHTFFAEEKYILFPFRISKRS